MSLCLCVCLCVCVSVCVHDNSKNNGSIRLKLEHIVVYENSSDEFDIGHCPINAFFFSIYHNTTVKSYISALAHVSEVVIKYEC